MLKFGRIEHNKVVEVFDLHEHHPTLNTLEGLFPPSLVFLEAPADVAEGWPVFNGTIVAPDYYKVLRAVAYPTVGDQLDAIWKLLHALAVDAPPDASAIAVQDRIDEIKALVPKP